MTIALSLLVVASTAVGGNDLTLEQAIALAQEQVREVVHARQDVLLVDVEKMSALSAILPRVDLTFGIREDFLGTTTAEFRSILSKDACYVPTGDLTIDSQNSLPACEGVLVQERSFGPFVDANYVNTPSHPNFRFGLVASQLLYDGGRWWKVLERVDDIDRAQAALLQLVQNNARNNVVSRFYDLEKTTRGVATVEAQVALASAQLERARGLLEAGKGKPEDVASAERNQAQDRVNLARRKFDASTAQRALNLAMGRDPNTPVKLVLPPNLKMDQPPPRDIPPVAELIERGTQDRPEVRRLEADVARIAKNVAIRSADYWPRVQLTARYDRFSRRPDRVFNNPFENYYASVGLDVSWNVFNGRATDASVQQGELELNKANASLDDLKRGVANDVTHRAERLALLFEVYGLARDGDRAAAEAVRLAQALYKQGRGSALELRDAELQLTQARLSLTNARLDIEIAREDLRRAIGGPIRPTDEVQPR